MQSQQQLQDSSLYVIVIVKKPLVALRYQLPDGQVKWRRPDLVAQTKASL